MCVCLCDLTSAFVCLSAKIHYYLFGERGEPTKCVHTPLFSFLPAPKQADKGQNTLPKNANWCVCVVLLMCVLWAQNASILPHVIRVSLALFSLCFLSLSLSLSLSLFFCLVCVCVCLCVCFTCAHVSSPLMGVLLAIGIAKYPLPYQSPTTNHKKKEKKKKKNWVGWKQIG